MARDSLAAAKTELYDSFQAAGVPTIARVISVFDYEPTPGELSMATAITVSSTGIGPSEFRLTVRIYVQVAGSMQMAQQDMDLILMDVDHAVSSGFGDSDWRIRYLEDVDMLRAECVYECTREDV